MPERRLSEQEFLSGLVRSRDHVVVVGPSRSIDFDPSLAHICSLVTHSKGRVTVVDPKMRYVGIPSGKEANSFSLEELTILSKKSEGIIGGAMDHLDSLKDFQGKNPSLLLKNPALKLGTATTSKVTPQSADLWFLRGTHSWVTGEASKRGTRFEQMIEEGNRVLKPGGKQIYFFEKSDPEQLAAFVTAVRIKQIRYELHKLRPQPYSIGNRTIRPHYSYYLALVLHKE